MKTTAERGRNTKTAIATLRALVLAPDVRESERAAFQDMLDRIEAHPLSEKQWLWIEGVVERANVDDNRNLVSRGLVPRGNPERIVLPWEKPGVVKALKPPGRR
jgi:hypothetical protein